MGDDSQVRAGAASADSEIIGLVNLERLRAYLDTVVDLPGEIELDVLSGGRSNLTYRVRSGPDEYVLRRRPLGTVAAGAHDMAREYRVQSALQGSDIPLAKVYSYSSDESVVGAPFYVMSRVHGRVFHRKADVAQLDADEATEISRAMVDILDRLHRVDYRSVGLGDLGRPEGFVRRRIGRWLDQWRRGVHRDHELVEPLADQLSASVPEVADSTLVHGDYRLGNAIVTPSVNPPVAAVLDWEMSTLGDPMTDLAHLLVYWDRTRGRLTHESQTISEQPGFLSSTELANRYSEQSGRDLSHLSFYMAFEHWRAAIIKEGIYARSQETDPADGEVDDIGDTVALHLEEAAQILSEL